MGWASLLADSVKNPFTSFLGDSANAIRGVGVGLASGTDLNTGMANAAQYAAQGAEKDDAFATQKKEEAKRQEQLQKAVDNYRNAGMADIADWLSTTGPDGLDLAAQQFWKRKEPGYAQADMPANIQEWEYFNNLGPEDQSKYLTMKRSVPYLDQGTQFGRPDPLTGVVGAVVPKDNEAAAAQKAAGGVLGTNQAERQIQAPIQNANLQRLDAQTDNVIETIDKAGGQAAWDSTGLIGQVLGGVAGTKAFDLRETAKTVKANLGFAELQAMRDASPTGGALGQVAVQELESLQSTLASLNPDQSEDQLRENLNKVRELLERQKTYRRMASEAKFGTPAPSGANAPEGVWVYNPASGKLEKQ